MIRRIKTGDTSKIMELSLKQREMLISYRFDKHQQAHPRPVFLEPLPEHVPTANIKVVPTT